MSPVITALEEYGVPLQLGERIVPLLKNPQTLDEALTALSKRRVADISGLTGFERTLVRPLCRDT